MPEWKTVKLAKVLRYRKGNILINNDEEYSLCRVQLHRRGVVLREKKMGSQIKTKKQQVCRAGDLVVAEMDAKFGGYGFIPNHLDGAIVSSHYYLYELDKSKITQEYFEILIKTDFIQNQIEAKGSTNYSSIRAWEFLDYEIPIQSIALQNSIAAKYLKHSRFKDDFGIELNAQLKYLSQLRQAVLQEAVEGRLTAKWRDEHPDFISGDNHASKLLEKIKAEKERLIKEGKSKKGKPLAPISDVEKSFELPVGWVWCRFGDYAIFERGRFSIRPRNDKSCYGGKYPFIQIGSLSNNGNVIEDFKQTLNEKGFSVSKQFGKGTIAIAIVGGTIGNLGVLGSDMCFPDSMVGIKPMLNSNQDYILLLLRSKQPEIRKAAYQMAGQPNIKLPTLTELDIALPPLSEQQAIVERLNILMTVINDLEKLVSERKEQSEMLMQSVLREAFAKG